VTDVFITKQRDKLKLVELLKGTEMPYKVTVKKGGSRSIQQNRYLFGICYETILDHGLRDDGWRIDDIHEYFLGEYFGWETLSGFGKKRLRPIDRSSNMSKMEFVDYVAFVQQKAAEMGIVIPDPEDING